MEIPKASREDRLTKRIECIIQLHITKTIRYMGSTEYISSNI